ncbi:C40 family peptidase [Nigerium massiliense]|uniref:C40 family peptidase n=1 Tax=Nigerium massiliense TaxID=1522317 RepID=UPI00058AEDB8|nr:C40 family peptidase [Nigerium massiliense]
MSRSRKFLVSAAVVSLTSALSITGFSSPEAVAAPAPAPSIEKVKADIARIEGESKAIEENYAEQAIKVDNATARLNVARKQAAAQQAEVAKVDAKAKAAVAAAVSRFSTKGADAAVVREFTVQADKLAQLNNAAAAQASGVAAAKQTLGQLAAQGDAKAAEGDSLLNSLSPENQKVLEDEAATERARSEATASEQQAAIADAAKVAAQGGVQADQLAGAAQATGAQSLSIASNIKDARMRKVVSYALSRVGKSQYVWGATGPWRFDCSGLMLASYRQIGVGLPHSSRVQARRGRWVSRYAMKPGDLIFYYSPISHVAMYAGSGYIVHARNTRVDIVLQKFAAYPAKFNTARRIVG